MAKLSSAQQSHKILQIGFSRNTRCANKDGFCSAVTFNVMLS